ncbi:hypothetical protein [Streptomyces sp. S1]|uniref:hypothetical protein n=1 Tax=Streptomyces sp. S1 TaxID=718288 RepID=UPI003D7220F9
MPHQCLHPGCTGLVSDHHTGIHTARSVERVMRCARADCPEAYPDRCTCGAADTGGVAGEHLVGCQLRPEAAPGSLDWFAEERRRRDAARDEAGCSHPYTWFDRSVCADPCGSMHDRCIECGVVVGHPCALDRVPAPLSPGAVACTACDWTRSGPEQLLLAAFADHVKSHRNWWRRLKERVRQLRRNWEEAYRDGR